MTTDRRRNQLSYQVTYALRHPGRVVPHLRRVARDRRLRKASGGNHVAYYRSVMADDASRNPEAAVGSARHDRWLALGKMQYDYLVKHGLRPEHRMLEIGCGNLRAGWRFIDHLDAGNYYGIDISPDILLDALRVVAERDIAQKVPNLTLVQDLRFGFLPDEHFDVVHAHSVFSHSPLNVIDECLSHVGRILKPEGWFDFTFDRTEGEEHHVLNEDFYYRTETLVSLAESHGLHAEFMSDWEELPHKQSKIRVRRK